MARQASVVWTRPGLNSLLAIVRHIQTDNPPAAQRFAQSIKTKVARLKRFPESGRVVPEFPSTGLRELVVGDYRVIYRYVEAGRTVQILTVWHGTRLLETPPAEEE